MSEQDDEPPVSPVVAVVVVLVVLALAVSCASGHYPRQTSHFRANDCGFDVARGSLSPRVCA